MEKRFFDSLLAMDDVDEFNEHIDSIELSDTPEEHIMNTIIANLKDGNAWTREKCLRILIKMPKQTCVIDKLWNTLSQVVLECSNRLIMDLTVRLILDNSYNFDNVWSRLAEREERTASLLLFHCILVESSIQPNRREFLDNLALDNSLTESLLNCLLFDYHNGVLHYACRSFMILLPYYYSANDMISNWKSKMFESSLRLLSLVCESQYQPNIAPKEWKPLIEEWELNDIEQLYIDICEFISAMLGLFPSDYLDFLRRSQPAIDLMDKSKLESVFGNFKSSYFVIPDSSLDYATRPSQMHIEEIQILMRKPMFKSPRKDALFDNYINLYVKCLLECETDFPPFPLAELMATKNVHKEYAMEFENYTQRQVIRHLDDENARLSQTKQIQLNLYQQHKTLKLESQLLRESHEKEIAELKAIKEKRLKWETALNEKLKVIREERLQYKSECDLLRKEVETLKRKVLELTRERNEVQERNFNAAAEAELMHLEKRVESLQTF